MLTPKIPSGLDVGRGVTPAGKNSIFRFGGTKAPPYRFE